MDVGLPGLDGIETTKLIRKNEQQTNKHIPIIALTTHAYCDDIERCLKAGMDEYISKPIDEVLLFKTIIKLIQ